ncbi:Sodium/myo-inositol cotransporter [Hypsibius exemplaris]|uniref:Sodium/myo-inositol cotransporter n=1 Tax=Hypsibius exemplaris TaxID=2072580 RepID=A0A9X6NL76_HYPEX|nr:Sodium/myo-inositol cotransporter [Hypsibius exemplaris]
MLSSLVSDLLSIFNSASALFTIDIWSKIRKNAQAREILIVGRLFNVILLAISVLWVPLIQQVQGGQMFFYIKAIGAYLGPPIGAIFVLALFWKRCNESGAFYGLMVGLVVGLIRMGLDFTFRSPECGIPDERPAITRDVHYMYFAFILFTVTIVAAVVVSLTTPPSDVEKLVRTTFTTRFDETRRPDDFRYDRRPSRALSGVPPIEEFGCLETDDVTGSNGLKTDPLDEHEEERGSGFLLRSRTKLVDFCFGNAAPTQDEKDAHDAHLAKVSSLDQSPGAKLFLNINLGLLLILVIFVFILFSQ